MSRVLGERNFVGGFSGFGLNQQHLERQQLPKKKCKNDTGSFFLPRYWTDTVENNEQCCLALLKLPKRLFFHHKTWFNYSPPGWDTNITPVVAGGTFHLVLES